VHGPGDHGHLAGRAGLAGHHRVLRAAHVARDGLHRQQHHHGADHLGGPVDELRGAEHRPDAVQDVRLAAGAAAGPAGGPRPHRRGHPAGRLRAARGARGRPVHQLRAGRHGQGQDHHRGGRALPAGRPAHPRAGVLVGQYYHPGLLQPPGARGAEARDGRRPVRGLGGRGAAAAGGRAALLLVPAAREEVPAHQDPLLGAALRRPGAGPEHSLRPQGLRL
ncbi:claudin-3, partial [Daubentonia madagascariensis]